MPLRLMWASATDDPLLGFQGQIRRMLESALREKDCCDDGDGKSFEARLTVVKATVIGALPSVLQPEF